MGGAEPGVDLAEHLGEEPVTGNGVRDARHRDYAHEETAETPTNGPHRDDVLRPVDVVGGEGGGKGSVDVNLVVGLEHGDNETGGHVAYAADAE